MKLTSLNWVIFAFIFVSYYDDVTIADSSSCGNWTGFKDEKCYKILDDTFRTFDEAEKACEKLEDNPTLPVIHTKEEQDFLSNYLFKTQKKLDNFWIGAKFSTNQFHWIDNTDWSFTNWDTRGQRNKTGYCIQIQADESVTGKWIDEPCERKSLVVCQKMQSWSTARLQKVLLDARKEFRDSLDASNKVIADLQHNLVEANKKIDENKLSLIPIGFIYPQLPTEKSPTEIWPSLTWTDVSASYAGVFFRVSGGDSAAFGQVQEENAPRIAEILTGSSGHIVTKTIEDFDKNITIPKTGWSSGILTGGMDGYNIYTNFKHSTGEIRPRNMAIKVWKRTS